MRSLLSVVNDNISFENFHNINISKLFFCSTKFKATHHISEILQNNYQSKYRGSEFEIFDNIVTLMLEAQKKELLEIRKVFINESIDFMVLKGLYFINQFKQSAYYSSDIDVIVKKHEILSAKNVLNRLHYSQLFEINNGEYVKFTTEQISKFDNNHSYGLAPFKKLVRVKSLDSYVEFIIKNFNRHPFYVKKSNVYLVIEFDLHHNVSKGVEVSDIWDNPQKFNICNTSFFTPSVEFYGWFLPARLYYELMFFHKQRLKLLSYLLLLIKNNKINYDLLSKLCQKYKLFVPGYYIYRFINKHTNSLIPIKFIKFCEQGMIDTAKAGKDYGDFLPPIMDERIVYNINLN